MKSLFILLKKIFHQFVGRANDAYDKYSDPIVSIRQARRDIKTTIDNLSERFMEVSINSKQIDHMIEESKKEYSGYESEAREALKAGDQEAANRAANRAIKIKDRLDSFTNSSQGQLDMISNAVEKLRTKEDDLKFEERHLEMLYNAAKLEEKVLQLDSSIASDGVTSLQTVLEDARNQVREAQFAAESRREMNEQLAPKDDLKYTTESQSERTSQFLKSLES